MLGCGERKTKSASASTSSTGRCARSTITPVATSNSRTSAPIDPEIREFQQDLRKSTEGSISGTEDSDYSEAKFLEVKRIMERLRGRDGFAETDKRWTRKVTDVRNWFVFSASERHRADDTEHEHYSDSGGKSGGQKEKLAYTVLAAESRLSIRDRPLPPSGRGHSTS